jgi:hypothetical protein
MIDYYLHKHCSLVSPSAKHQEKLRCSGCVWLDKEIRMCIFGVHYPKTISIEDLTKRIKNVNEEQQANLSETFRRFL